jgi:hypothetical protein
VLARYPAYGYGYGTGYSQPAYGGYAYHPVTGNRIYATHHPVTGRRIYATAVGARHH